MSEGARGKLEGRCPIGGTHTRLSQAHLLWHQVQRDYADPDAFCANLNAAIQALRTITFVLQKEKDAIPEFETWYEGWREKLKMDPLMVWLVEARNRVEKEGDLQTRSSATISLIAGWGDPLPLAEASVDPLMTAEEIVKRLPDLTGRLPAEILRDGVLTVERRWVVRELPDLEVLDVLAHCYGVLAMLVVEAHELCGAAMRTFRRDSHEPRPVRTEHLQGRLPCMVATQAMRTAMLHLSEDAWMTSTNVLLRADPTQRDKVLAKYGHAPGELAARAGEDLLESGAKWFEAAKRVLVRDGYHVPIAVLVMPDGERELHGLKIDDRQGLLVLMRRLADEIERTGAVGLIYVAEFWSAPAADLKRGQRASEAPTRRELLSVLAAKASGELRSYVVKFAKNDRGEVRLEESWVDDGLVEDVGMLEPVWRVWKRLKAAGPSAGDHGR